jgi:hypothetical protein
VQEFASVEIVGCLHPQSVPFDLQITSVMVVGFHSYHMSVLVPVMGQPSGQRAGLG